MARFSHGGGKSGRRNLYEDDSRPLDESSELPFDDLDLDQLPFAAGGAGQVYRGVLRKSIQVVAKRTFAGKMTKWRMK